MAGKFYVAFIVAAVFSQVFSNKLDELLVNNRYWNNVLREINNILESQTKNQQYKNSPDTNAGARKNKANSFIADMKEALRHASSANTNADAKRLCDELEEKAQKYNNFNANGFYKVLADHFVGMLTQISESVYCSLQEIKDMQKHGIKE